MLEERSGKTGLWIMDSTAKYLANALMRVKCNATKQNVELSHRMDRRTQETLNVPALLAPRKKVVTAWSHNLLTNFVYFVYMHIVLTNGFYYG